MRWFPPTDSFLMSIISNYKWSGFYYRTLLWRLWISNHKIVFSAAFNTNFEIELQNTNGLSSKAGVLLFLSWYCLIVKCWKQFCFMMDVSTSTIVESQIDFDLLTPQRIPTDKPLQIIISKDSSTTTIKEGKETFVHVVIESLRTISIV